MKPALAQVCSLNAPFESDLEEYAAGKVNAIELWLGKLENYLATHSVDDVRRLLERHELVAPVASFQGGLLITQGAARAEHWEHFSRRLEICRQLGVQTLIVAGDITGPLSHTDLERASLSLGQAATLAADKEVRIALEFRAEATFANNLLTAAAMVAEVGHPNLGICFDVFHYYCGPSKPDDLAYLTTDNLFHVQLCDLAGLPRELAKDEDRILPGEGDFVLEPILNLFRELGYEGYVSIELMNPQIWQVPPRQFGEVAITALRKLLGQASMV
ncbi:MAG: sugar phosphate isomerase/epimerase [Pirellulales bacterium]|nr:sugar phosphate isomerase/epimerase [Pirellulales bacterium]